MYAKTAAWTPGKSVMVCSGLESGRARSYKPPNWKVKNYFFEGFMPFIVPC